MTRAARGTTSKKQKLAVTSQGESGLLLVQPDGTQLDGILKGPVAPVPPASHLPKPVAVLPAQVGAINTPPAK